MIDELKVNARCLGWGFLLAWVFCAFYSGSMDGLSMVVDAMGGGVARRLAMSVLPVGSAVVSLVVIVAAERRLGPPTNCRALVVAAPLAVTVTTPMLFLPAYGFAATPFLFAVSAVLTGAGSALMWVMWGQLYARLPQDAVESCAPASAFVAALLSIAAMAAPQGASIALVSAFPLVSGALLWRAWSETSALASADHASLPAAPLPVSHGDQDTHHQVRCQSQKSRKIVIASQKHYHDAGSENGDGNGRNGMSVEHLQQLNVCGDDGDQVSLVPPLQLGRAELAQSLKDFVANDSQQLEGNIVIAILFQIVQNPPQHRKCQHQRKDRFYRHVGKDGLRHRYGSR